MVTPADSAQAQQLSAPERLGRRTLRELGRIARKLFILDWRQRVGLCRRVHAGLNNGESRNALARAVFFNRLGEIRDCSFEQQRQDRRRQIQVATSALRALAYDFSVF